MPVIPANREGGAMSKFMSAATVCVLLIGRCSSPAQGREEVSADLSPPYEVVGVEGGNRLRVLILDAGGSVSLRTVRLLGTEPPESDKPAFLRAVCKVKELVAGKPVRLGYDKKAQKIEGDTAVPAYVITHEGKDIGLELLRSGLAGVSRHESFGRRELYEEALEGLALSRAAEEPALSMCEAVLKVRKLIGSSRVRRPGSIDAIDAEAIRAVDQLLGLEHPRALDIILRQAISAGNSLDRDDPVQRHALVSLEALGEAAIEPLAAAAALGDAKAKQVLLKMDSGEARSVLLAYAAITDDAATDPASSTHPRLARNMRAVMEKRTAENLLLLLKVIGEPSLDAEFRNAAIPEVARILIARASPEATALLTKIMLSEYEPGDLRRSAARALRRCEDPAVIKALASAASQEELAEVAKESLTSIRTRRLMKIAVAKLTASEVEAFLEDPDPWMRMEIAHRIQGLGAPQPLAVSLLEISIAKGDLPVVAGAYEIAYEKHLVETEVIAEALREYGDIDMARRFINCEDRTLRKAAVDWAKENDCLVLFTFEKGER